MNDNFKTHLLKNFLQVGLYKYSGQVIIFFSSVVTSRLLKPEEFGTVALITVFSAFITSFLDAGFRFATIRHKMNKTYYSALHFLVILYGAILGGLMIAISYPVALFYNKQELFYPALVLGLVIFLSSFRIIPAAILDKKMRFKVTAQISFITTLTSIFFVILFALMGLSYWALILPQLLMHYLAYILLKRKIAFQFVIPHKTDLKEAFLQIKTLAGNVSWFTFFNYWQRNTDNLLIGKLFGEHALGLYSRAYALLEMPIHMISGVLQQVLFPSFQKQIDANKGIKKDHMDLIRILNIIIFPVPIILLCFPYEVSTLLWGADWEKVGDFLPVFGTLIILQTPFFTAGPMMILHKKDNYFAIIGSINASVLIAAIIMGGQMSLMHIIYYYAFAYICFCVPFTAYWAHIRTFGFTFIDTLKSFGFEWGISLLMLVAVVFSNHKILLAAAFVYGIVKIIQGALTFMKYHRIKRAETHNNG